MNRFTDFGEVFFVLNEAKNADITLAMASIFNEVKGEKYKSKM